MKDTYVHLTNYAINKNNKKFIFNQDDTNMDKGHKRSLSFIFKYLAKKGVDIQLLKHKIEHIIVKTLLIGQPMLSHVYHLSQPDNISNDLAFHILGFDVLIKDDYEPVLIEINHTPSFTTDTPLDKKIKKNLIKDTFKILNISVESKK
jgi:tubulin polyglutamylase TTLL6/13